MSKKSYLTIVSAMLFEEICAVYYKEWDRTLSRLTFNIISKRIVHCQMIGLMIKYFTTRMSKPHKQKISMVSYSS